MLTAHRGLAGGEVCGLSVEAGERDGGCLLWLAVSQRRGWTEASSSQKLNTAKKTSVRRMRGGLARRNGFIKHQDRYWNSVQLPGDGPGWTSPAPRCRGGGCSSGALRGQEQSTTASQPGSSFPEEEFGEDESTRPSFQKQVWNPSSAQDSTSLPMLTQRLTLLATASRREGRKSPDRQLSTSFSGFVRA